MLFAAGTKGSLPDNIRVFEADATTESSKAALSEAASTIDQAANPCPLSLAAAISFLNNPVTEVVLGRGIPPLPSATSVSGLLREEIAVAMERGLG